MCDVYSGATARNGIYQLPVPGCTRHSLGMSTSRRPPHDPGDDVSSMCVNLRILSRLTQGEKLCSVKDKYYAVQDGTTYQASLLRYVRNDSRRETCAAIEVRRRSSASALPASLARRLTVCLVVFPLAILHRHCLRASPPRTAQRQSPALTLCRTI